MNLRIFQGNVGLTVLPRESTRRTVPAALVAGLLFVCLFAPYGVLPFGGGTLRPDHIAVTLVFGWAIATRRIRAPGPLAAGYLGFLVVVAISSIINWDLVTGSGWLSAVKNLDGLVRGLEVLLIASSIPPTAEAGRPIVAIILGSTVLLAIMGLAERLVPDSSIVNDVLVPRYGGPVQEGTIYALLGRNHKAMLLEEGRATAVFVTAPALAMTAVFVLPTIIKAAVRPAWVRWVLLAFAIVAGLMSNSKSFLFGVPVLLLAWSAVEGKWGRAIALGSAVTAVVVVAVFVLNRYQPQNSFDPFARLEEASQTDGTLYVATGGRVGDDAESIFRPTEVVLTRSPAIGFGVGMLRGVDYADSALNRLLLHGGVIGCLAFLGGLWLQLRWFYERRTSWSALHGLLSLLMVVAFFTAGAVFMMPRVNDLAFTLIGSCIAASPVRARMRSASLPSLDQKSRPQPG